ncbi:MAG: hypothetical protein QOF52_768 [Propionibacteriaceae bacterium]|jgi:hypothetical protein|nr:hypothetical protein [Propionibacteriaceae bacterium]MDX6320910.1 hypothetical protein [Propionibacteriaceae bacterium]
MSQPSPAGGLPGATATAPPPVPGVATGAPATAPASTPETAATAPRTTDTPRRLRRFTTAMIITGVLFGLVGALVFARLAYGMQRAEDNTAQLIRVQQIQSNLLTADATATNAFLVGGLEPEAQRVRYDQAINATATLIAQAAEAQPADAAALATLNQSVLDYAAGIEQARANNRQGFPVGAQYLRDASADLRSQALPVLDNLNTANTGRAADEMELGPAWVFIVVGLLALAALTATMVVVARQFRRTINVGLLAAGIVVAVALVGATFGLVQLSSHLSDVRQSSFSTVTAAANARIQANNAKSNESLTLIARGSGAGFEKAWATAADQVQGSLDSIPDADLPSGWKAYVDVHRQIRTLDDGGGWDKAVDVATGTGAQSSNATFNAFDTAVSTELDSASASVAAELSAPRIGLVIAALLLLAAGLAAAVLARWGLAQRLREYR